MIINNHNNFQDKISRYIIIIIIIKILTILFLSPQRKNVKLIKKQTPWIRFKVKYIFSIKLKLIRLWARHTLLSVDPLALLRDHLFCTPDVVFKRFREDLVNEFYGNKTFIKWV